MIVKMKKVLLITTTHSRITTLRQLRKLGVVHIETAGAPGDTPSPGGLQTDLDKLYSALQQLSLYKPRKGLPPHPVCAAGDGSQAAATVTALEAARQQLKDELTRLRLETERMQDWGDFQPAELTALRAGGINLGLYEVPQEVLYSLAESPAYLLLETAGQRLKIAVSGLPPPGLAEYALRLPACSLAALQQQVAEKTSALAATEQQLVSCLPARARIQAAAAELEKQLEFQQLSQTMAETAGLSYLTGYLPAEQAGLLKQAAAVRGWGLALDDPAEDDPVPTLIRNPRWIGIIKPVFGMLGTVPGYREYDISFWFLLFFSLFFAMLIGDAGYGLIILLLTILARLKLKKAGGGIFALFYVMSFSTILWGALTGTWFGAESLAYLPLLRRITLPWLASFPDPAWGINTVQFMMRFCFILGAVHLTIARLLGFFRKFPKLAAFAELGWAVLLWGLYLLVLNIVLQLPLHPATLWLIGAGLTPVILFSEQQGNFFKGLAMGLAKLPLKALDAISGFSDIISYVRLFAVGLASVEVAKAFNIMALNIGFGNVFAGLVTTLILVAGHTLNIIMGAMSIVVHGVRLNMLEFSGHLGMEWAGREYKPFKE